MQREMRVCDGAVNPELEGTVVLPDNFVMAPTAFLTHLVDGTRILYRKGEGVTIERSEGADPRDAMLYLNGSVYAAAACINGLYPIHASAVAVNGKVHAFTGPSGAGKSTLIAALGLRGFPMFCDDTLVLDMRGPDHLVCLPGHKRLKLMPDAVKMTGAMPEERVASAIDKNFAAPAAGTISEPMPLAELVFLEEGDSATISPITGGERMMRLQDDHYTALFFEIAQRPDRAERFRQLSRLARSIAINRFVRPRDAARFADDVTVVVDHLNSALEQHI
jgi:hypothetical protein